MRPLPPARRLIARAALLLALWMMFRAELPAQQRPVEVSAAQAATLPYRLSGRLNVTFGGDGYFGTATYIRRYTGLTAGHLLYDPKGGLATNLYYEPALYQMTATDITISFFAVLAGYQDAADVDPDADAAFAHDTGYLLFSRPALGAEWADFTADPDVLVNEASFLVFGYAGEDGFPGDVQAFVNVKAPYYQIQSPALYENSTYYTEGGMSGGPLYITTTAGVSVAAVTVAGTSPKDAALSDVRAITAAEQPLFIEAEYVHGLIASGTIKGPATVAAGGAGKFKTGVVFKDGVQEGRDLVPRYDELYLRAVGPHKKQVTITKLRTGRFKVEFSNKLASGDVITLHLLRNTVDASAQVPLKTTTVAVQ